MTKKKEREIFDSREVFATFDEYIANFLPAEIMFTLRELASRRKFGLLNESMYSEAVIDFVKNKIPEEVINMLTNSICKDFELRECSFSRHFIARLLIRFSGSAMNFLMTRIRRLFYYCCKHGKERGRENGIVLVVNPAAREIITIFTC